MEALVDYSSIPNFTNFKLGYALYKGVVIEWSEHKDDYVYNLIDSILEDNLPIALIYDNNRNISITWKDYAPYIDDEWVIPSRPEDEDCGSFDIWIVSKQKIWLTLKSAPLDDRKST